jgi:hypothetical protein
MLDCEIRLYGVNHGLITSPHFTIIVDSRAVKAEKITSTSQYKELDTLYADTNALKGKVENSLGIISNSIRGTASGTALTLTDVSPIEHEMKVKVKSKNMIPIVPKTTVQNGITFVANNDGSVAVTGTATDNAFIVFHYVLVEANKKYWISSGVSGSSGSTYQMCANCEEIGISNMYHISTASFVPAVSGKVSIYIYVYKGNTVNLTFYPMLNEGANALPFIPYVDVSTSKVVVNETETITPTEDGTVRVTSLYPTTTILCDTEGVTIDVEYNKDANKVIAELIDLIGSRGGSFVTDVNILASKWVGTSSPYSQVVTVEGATKRSQVDLTPSADQLAIFHNKDLAFVTENNNGVITVYAIGQKPVNDYTIQATVTEVKV